MGCPSNGVLNTALCAAQALDEGRAILSTLNPANGPVLLTAT